MHARALAELMVILPGAEPGVGDGRAYGSWSAQTEEVLATFRAVALVQDGSSAGRFYSYVVSFTRSADDIAAVYELARYAMDGGPIPWLDVVPLFESAADLAQVHLTC